MECYKPITYLIRRICRVGDDPLQQQPNTV